MIYKIFLQWLSAQKQFSSNLLTQEAVDASLTIAENQGKKIFKNSCIVRTMCEYSISS